LTKGKSTEEISLKAKSFIVRSHPADMELERKLGASIFKASKLKVDFKNPEVIVRVFQNCIGIDKHQQRLSARAYRVFTTRHSLNPVSAFALANSNKKNLFIITSDGAPLIETSLKAHHLPIPRDPARLKPDNLQDGNFQGIALNNVLKKGARQNAMLAAAPVVVLDREWPKVELSEYERIIAPLNFVRTADGITAKAIFKKLLDAKRELVVLILTEKAPNFKSPRIKQRTNFLQGKLPLTILRISAS